MKRKIIVALLAVFCGAGGSTFAATQEPPVPDLLQQLIDKHSGVIASAGTQRGEHDDTDEIFTIVRNACGNVHFPRSPHLPVYLVWPSSEFTLQLNDLGQSDETVKLMVNGTEVEYKANSAKIDLPVPGVTTDWVLIEPGDNRLAGRIRRLSQADSDTVNKRLGPIPDTEENFSAADHYAILDIYAEYGMYFHMHHYIQKRKTLMRDEQFRGLACAALIELVPEK